MNILLDFIVFGAGKSGTTSLHEYLRQHPNISLPKCKETYFFNCDKNSDTLPLNLKGRILPNYIDNMEDYSKAFETKSEPVVYGEVCPSYFYDPMASNNIKIHKPDIKLLCILRNPVDRFYSNYKFYTTKYSLPEFNLIMESIIEGKCNPQVQRFLDIGFYFHHLSHYYSLFPESNIKVFLFEDLVNCPEKLMDDFMDFIGLARYPFEVQNTFNRSGSLRYPWILKYIYRTKLSKFIGNSLPKSLAQKIKPIYQRAIIKNDSDKLKLADREQLAAIYMDDMIKLQSLIKRDLAQWIQK